MNKQAYIWVETISPAYQRLVRNALEAIERTGQITASRRVIVGRYLDKAAERGFVVNSGNVWRAA